jgi:uncharacterized Zn finger protein (UPF0148 family)
MNEQYPIFDEKGKIVCQICGKSFQFISPRHLKKHAVTTEQYKKRFPNIPLTTKQFNAKSKYARYNKDLFDVDSEKQEKPLEDDPVIEELDLREELEKTVRKLDPMESMKKRILDHLLIYFSNVQQDYILRQTDPQNRLLFEFVTDFCDPILRVVFQFPDTFWHNKEYALDPNKNYKLESHGWKVIEIGSTSPSLDKIDEAIRKF